MRQEAQREVYGKVFPVMWAITLLLDRSVRGTTLDVPTAAITLAALAVLVLRTAPALGVLCAVHLGWLASTAPNVLFVHWYLDGVIDLAVLTAYAHAAVAARSLLVSTGDLARAFAPVGRVLVVLALFFVGFAKLNSAFLDPEYSCAAALYDF